MLFHYFFSKWCVRLFNSSQYFQVLARSAFPWYFFKAIARSIKRIKIEDVYTGTPEKMLAKTFKITPFMLFF